MTKYILVAALLAASATSAASETIKYECTFAEGKLSRPTPTRVVFSVDPYSQYGELEAVEIPGVRTSVGPIKVVRNNLNVLSVEWSGQGYEFTAETKESGGLQASPYLNVDFLRHRFSVFLKKRHLKANVRSESIGHRPLSGHSSGTCNQL